MKFSFSLLATAVLVTAVACTKDKIRGEGAVTTQSRNTGSFDRVVTNGSTQVHITQGATIGVQVKGYGNLLPHLETKVAGSTLSIGFESGTNVSNDNTEVFITLPSLKGVRVNGSADVDATGPFTETTVDAASNGSGNILLRQITAQTLRTEINGSGNIRAFGFTAQRAEVRTSGSGDTEVWVSESLKADLTGSGSVYYKGTARQIDSKVSGSGKVEFRP